LQGLDFPITHLQITSSSWVVAGRFTLIPSNSQFKPYPPGQIPLPPKIPILNKPEYGNFKEILTLEIKNAKLRKLLGNQ